MITKRLQLLVIKIKIKKEKEEKKMKALVVGIEKELSSFTPKDSQGAIEGYHVCLAFESNKYEGYICFAPGNEKAKYSTVFISTRKMSFALKPGMIINVDYDSRGKIQNITKIV